MATVTGLTASAMLAIRNGMVVDAHVDTSNHLILTKYDGTQIDAGTMAAASLTASGLVELATNAETLAGTDAVRAVTPAGLASIPGNKVQVLSGIAESAAASSYPLGLSVMNLSTGSSWSLNSGFGYLMTNRTDTDRAYQIFAQNAGGTQFPQSWMRSYHSSNGGGGWTAWSQHNMVASLTAASFTQATAFTSYPSGWSRLYYTSGTSTSWDFSGYAGEVMTYVNGTDFARQEFFQHTGGSSARPIRWFRVANSASGWSSWMVVRADPGDPWLSYTPSWASNGTGTPSLGNATVDCKYNKIGRQVELRFEIVFGSTTNFGNTGTGDNWLFGLPPAAPAARSGDSLGFVELHGPNNSTVAVGRARTTTTTTFLTGLISGYPSGASITNTGDVDSVTPFTWASGHSYKGNFSYESAA